MRRLAPLLPALLALAALVAAAPAAAAERFATSVLSLVPPPGYPAQAYVRPDGLVYEGTYDNPSGDTVPSRVFEITAGGTLQRSWTVQGQDLSQPHGVQVATSDGTGRLVLLDKSPARALLLDPRTGAQTTYATFPAGTVPNYAAWGPDGSLYVTDYEHPVVYRVPPGGGTPTEWLRSPLLDGGAFGATGILLQADRRTLLVGVQSGAGGGAGNPTSGRLLRVPIGDDGRPGAPSVLWESRPFDGPDGFAIAQSGRVYVALLLANQLAVIAPDGHELERTSAAGSPVPFDSPSNARFLGTRVVVANQAYASGDRSHQAVLAVETGEPGLPELVPPAPAATTPTASTPAPAPVVRKRKARARHRHRRHHRRHRHRHRHRSRS